MSYREPLSQQTVAVSISETPDMPPLGLATEHLTDAMTEVARHLLALGSRLMYGGDLRPNTVDAPGFTQVLFELVSRHRRDADLGDHRPALVNVLAWPVHQSITPSTVAQYQSELEGLVEFVTLDSDGAPIELRDLLRSPSKSPSDDDWRLGLYNMRRWASQQSDARIVLGGRITGFKGRMPGIAEEALVALSDRKPLFILGGFGGCARDIAGALGLLPEVDLPSPDWPGAADFTGGHYGIANLRNGLTYDENTTLAATPHIDEAVTLIIRGLLRVTEERNG